MVVFNNKFLGGIKELNLLVGTKYIYYLMRDNKKEVIENFAKYVKSSGVSTFPCSHSTVAIGFLYFYGYETNKLIKIFSETVCLHAFFCKQKACWNNDIFGN